MQSVPVHDRDHGRVWLGSLQCRRGPLKHQLLRVRLWREQTPAHKLQLISLVEVDELVNRPLYLRMFV